jgi:SET family sugar efflux transporter-like MFS transporter
MPATFRTVWSDPTLRMLFLLTLLFGTFICCIGPFQSLVGVRRYGLSDAVYAALLMAALLVSIAVSVGIGILTDQRPSRRRMALLAVGALVLGGVAVWLIDTAIVFLLVHLMLIPVAGTLFGQIFAVMRLHIAPLPETERNAIVSVLRASMGIPWVLFLPVWAMVLTREDRLILIYPVLALLGLAMLALVLRDWPPDEKAPWREVKSGLGFRASIREMMAPPVMIRVMLIGALHAGGALAGVILGLVFAAAGRGADQIGLFFSALVAFEVLAMLATGAFAAHLSRLSLLVTGTVIYALFLALLPVLVNSPLLWALAILAGVGGALIYLPALGYLQDLLGNRAGAGASLIALQRLSSDGLAAAIYAFGAWASGYWLVAVLGAAVTLAAIATTLWLDRTRPLPHRQAG